MTNDRRDINSDWDEDKINGFEKPDDSSVNHSVYNHQLANLRNRASLNSNTLDSDDMTGKHVGHASNRPYYQASQNSARRQKGKLSVKERHDKRRMAKIQRFEEQEKQLDDEVDDIDQEFRALCSFRESNTFGVDSSNENLHGKESNRLLRNHEFDMRQW